MPPHETPIQKRRRLATHRGVTSYLSDFSHICKKKPNRIGIIAEGDSWFAYPRKWLAFGADINIVHHLEQTVAGTNSVNLLRLASNGDEAVDMTSGKQFRKLYKILKQNKDSIDILMFSGGGNDIVGKYDMLPLLQNYSEGNSYLDCIDHSRFDQKLEEIVLAYKRLILLCADIVPDAKIITHTYDIAKPWDQGGEFFWGLIRTKPWVYPYMVRRGIPTELHLPILEYMLTKFAVKIKALSQEPFVADRLVVVDTQGTLNPGSSQDWLNEIHPTSDGFNKIFTKIYDVMRTVVPDLPA